MRDLEQYLEKAGPYIGPRGGKWADPKHRIPWDQDKHGPKKQAGLFDRQLVLPDRPLVASPSGWDRIDEATSGKTFDAYNIDMPIRITAGSDSRFRLTADYGDGAGMRPVTGADPEGYQTAVEAAKVAETKVEERAAMRRSRAEEKKGRKDKRSAEAAEKARRVEAGLVFSNAQLFQEDRKAARLMDQRIERAGGVFDQQTNTWLLPDQAAVDRFEAELTAHSEKRAQQEDDRKKAAAEAIRRREIDQEKRRADRIEATRKREQEYAKENESRRASGFVVQGNTYPVKEKIKQAGGVWDRAGKVWLMPDREATEKMQALVDAAPAKEPTPVPAKAPSAKQVNYALSLAERLVSDDYGSATTLGIHRLTREQLERMSAGQVSGIIDAIRGEYDDW